MKPAPSVAFLNAIFLIQMGCGTATKLAPKAEIVVETPNVDVVATLASTEGPTVDRKGNVYFTFGGVTGGRIIKWSDEGGAPREIQPGLPARPGRLSTFREYGAAGLIFDHRGRLLAVSVVPIEISLELPELTSVQANWRC